MEELLEIITWAQLGIHVKPVAYQFSNLKIYDQLSFLLIEFVTSYYSIQVGLLNVDGYYNSLLALFDNGVEEGFIKPCARQIVVSAPTAKELVVKMEV